MQALIPDKYYFKIGEVAQITSLRPSVLRYWETEFETLKPNKSRSGQRLYTKNELELILKIKNLLYHEKLTIEGARKKLMKRCGVGEESINTNHDEVIKVLNEVKGQLRQIVNSL